jgi:hypothetical protein
VKLRETELTDCLGFGIDGVVYATTAPSAVKSFRREDGYVRERNCYIRLKDHEVLSVCGHAVPQLINHDDTRLIIEMTMVKPPFLLDFASAWLDRAPDFSVEAIELWNEEKAEMFGARWHEVRDLLRVLREEHGIHLTDVKIGNIAFADTDFT